MDYVIPLWVPMAVAVVGTDARFPVRRIYLVGRNYPEHAREMGADPSREEPFFFSKPADALVPGGGEVPYPPLTDNYQHEVELVVALGKGGAEISPGDAAGYVFGYAIGLDMTRRDLQAALKEKGRPWEMGKAFDRSAPIGSIHPAAAVGHPRRGSIELDVNGVTRQRGNLADMIWTVDEVIARLSRYVRLEAGDLVFSGTPAGVGRLIRGDRLVGRIEGLGELRVTVI